MSEERKLILNMLKEGKVDVEAATKLLEQVEAPTAEATVVTKSPNKKFLRVLVKEADETKVNINIPLALAEVGLKLIPKKELEIQGIDFNVENILQLIHEGLDGELVNVESCQNGKAVHVKVLVA